MSVPTADQPKSAHVEFGSSSPKSTSESLVREIIKGIYEGKYVPGQRLAEPDLMQEFSVSRSTVREAIKQLTADGIVTYVQYKGAQIRRLTRQDALNIFAIIEVVLGLAARLAAENINKSSIKHELHDYAEAVVTHDHTNHPFEFVKLQHQFFLKVIEIGGNSELTTIIPRLQVHVVRNRLLVPQAMRKQGYMRITRAIVEADSSKAETVTRDYIKEIARFTLPTFEEDTRSSIRDAEKDWTA